MSNIKVLNEFAALCSNEDLFELAKEKPQSIKLELFSKWQLEAKSNIPERERKYWWRAKSEETIKFFIVTNFASLVNYEWQLCTNKTISETEFYSSLSKEDQVQIINLTNKHLCLQ